MYPKTPFSGYVRLIKVTANLRYPIGFNLRVKFVDGIYLNP